MRKMTVMMAVMAAVVAVPAMAAPSDSFSGARIEATVGSDNVMNITDTTDFTYGAAIGIDAPVGQNFIVGVEANLDNVFNRGEFGASGRVGYAFNDKVMAYGKAGYTNYRDVFSRNLDGLRVGGGVELNIGKATFVGAEYRYSDLEANVGRHQGLVKVGLRF